MVIIWLMMVNIYIYIWLVVDHNPSEKWWSSSVGMMTFPTEWKVLKVIFQTTNQITIIFPLLVYSLWKPLLTITINQYIVQLRVSHPLLSHQPLSFTIPALSQSTEAIGQPRQPQAAMVVRLHWYQRCGTTIKSVMGGKCFLKCSKKMQQKHRK